MLGQDKELSLGQSLNDDLWHTLTFKRRFCTHTALCIVAVLHCCRGIMFESFVDDDEPRKGEETG